MTEDWLYWLLAAEMIVFFYMLLLRTRQILVALAPVFVTGFFLTLPHDLWWAPAIGAGLWLLLLPTARMRAIAVNKRVRWEVYLWMLIPSLPLAIWITYLWWKWSESDLFLTIFIGVLVLALAPFVFGMALLYVICPLFVFHKETCYARQSWNEEKVVGIGTKKSVTWYVMFGDDNSKYRTGLLFYHWVKRRSGLITYKKHTCLLGVRWISHCR